MSVTLEERYIEILKIARMSVADADTIDWIIRQHLRAAIAELDSDVDFERATQVFQSLAQHGHAAQAVHLNEETGLERLEKALRRLRTIADTPGEDTYRRQQMGHIITDLAGELLHFMIDVLEIDKL